MFAKAKRLLPIFLLIVILLSLIGCSEEGKITANITEQQLMDGITAATGDIDTYQIDMDMLMSMSGESEGETLDMSMSYAISGEVDNTNQKMHMTMSMEMDMGGWLPVDSMEMEMYLIENTMYVKDSAPGIAGEWEQETIPGLWDQQNQVGQQLELLETSEIELLGSERVNGVDCYKVKLVPDLEELYEIAMQDPTYGGMFGEMPFDPEEMFKNYSMTQWYAEDTHFPIKAVMEMTMVMSSEAMGIPGEDYEMEIDLEMRMDCSNFGEPVSIELPPEAV